MSYEEKYIKYKKKYLDALEKKRQMTATATGATGVADIMQGGAPSSDDNTKLIAFTAKWCGHCRHFSPLFNKLAKENKTKIEFINYDSELHKDKMKEYNIDGFPTLLLEHKGNRIEYNGVRSEKAILDFIKMSTRRKK